jgi:hypothetical protein
MRAPAPDGSLEKRNPPGEKTMADQRTGTATAPRHQGIDGNVTPLIQPGKSAGSPSGEKDQPCFARSW